jgi:DnaJ-class molecular chaperone
MYIQCPDCTKIELGIGMHLVEVYEVLRFHDAVKCIDCRGSGTQKTECHVCDGTGQVTETCTTCDGNGVLVDYSCEEGGEPEVLGIESVLVKKEK